MGVAEKKPNSETKNKKKESRCGHRKCNLGASVDVACGKGLRDTLTVSRQITAYPGLPVPSY